MKKVIFLILVTQLYGCASTYDQPGTITRIVEQYCALPEATRLSLRYAIDHDLVCIAGYVIPPGAGTVVRLYCATQYARPAIKDLVARDICGVDADRNNGDRSFKWEELPAVGLSGLSTAWAWSGY